VSHDLFISYSRRDNQANRITELKERIEADYLAFTGEPLHCFFDIDDIQGMDDWRHRILHGLRESQLFLLVLSPGYLASEYCQWEIVEYLKYEHSRAVGGQGVAPVYFVEVPGLDTPEFNQQAEDWIQRVRERNHFDLRPWYHEGEDALKQQDVRDRLEDLERSLLTRVSKLRRIAAAPGNLHGHNSHFVGREHEMRRLHESAGYGRFGVLSAIQGMGGLGKTALAIQYAYAYADFYPGGRWLVHCADQLSLAGAIRSLDVDLGITLDQADRTDDQRAAKRILAELEARAREGAAARAGEKSPPQPRALIILDNVEAPELLQPPHTELISGKNWLHVIATTRMSGEDFGHDPDRQMLMAVDELPLEDALRLIESHQPGGRFRDKAEVAAAREIVEILGGFTLAVEVVAVFLAERKGIISCTDFLERLRQEGFDRVAQDTRRPVNHQEKLVSATLEPTLGLLTTEETLVLTYASLLPPDIIPVTWLRGVVTDTFPEFGQDAEPGYDDSWLNLVNHLLGLRLLQLVNTEPENQAPRLVRMHRLTGEVVREKTAQDQQTGMFLEKLVNHALSRSEFLDESWFEPEARWEIEPLIVFVDLLISSGHEEAPRLVKNIGNWHSNTGDYERSETLHRKTIRLVESQMPFDELEIATLCSNLGATLHYKGQFEEAKENYRRALEITEQLRGSSHIDTAKILNGLATTLLAEHKLNEAEPMFRKSLEIFREVLPNGHPDIADSLNNLAVLVGTQGNLCDASKFCQESLNIRREALPSGHPNLAQSLGNLAYLLKAQGKLEEAEPLYRESLKIRREVLPSGHPDIAVGLNNLAVTLGAQNKREEAEPLYREALEIQRKAFPAGHPNIATSIDNLAVLLKSQGKLEEAESLHREGLRIHSMTLPLGHPNIARSLDRLASLLETMGKEQDATSLCRKALETRRKALPNGHPDIVESLIRLGRLYYIQDKFKEAEPVYREILEIRRQTLPKGHPDIAASLTNLANLYSLQNKVGDVEPMYREAIEIYRQALPEGNSDIAESLTNLASLLQEQGKFNEAEPMFRDALDFERNAHPEGHPNIAVRLNSLAILLRQSGRYSEAAGMLREAIEIEDANLPKEHPKRPHRRNNLSLVLILSGRYDDGARINAEAWQLKGSDSGGGHDMVSARILFNRIVLYWLCESDGSVFLGQLRSLLDQSNLPTYGSICPKWNADDWLKYLEDRLVAEQMRLLRGLVDAMNKHPDKVADLTKFPVWCNTTRKSLDTPWPTWEPVNDKPKE